MIVISGYFLQVYAWSQVPATATSHRVPSARLLRKHWRLPDKSTFGTVLKWPAGSQCRCSSLQPIDVWTTMMIRLDFFHWICAAVRDSDSKQIITSNICCLKVHLLLLSMQTTWHYCSLRPSHCGLKPSAATACLITFLWRLFAERYFQKGWDWEWCLNIGSSNVIYHPCDKLLVWVNQWLPCVQWIVTIVHELVSIQWNLQHRISSSAFYGFWEEWHVHLHRLACDSKTDCFGYKFHCSANDI